MNSQRDREIYKGRKSGKTLKYLATEYNLTVQRIRIICQMQERKTQEPFENKDIPPQLINALLNNGLSVKEAKQMSPQKLIKLKYIGSQSVYLLTGKKLTNIHNK